MANLLIGFMLAVGIAWLAHRAGALNSSGAIAAGVLGTVVFGLGGVGWAVVLLTFFITSSGLSRLYKSKKDGVGLDFAKGSRRDWGQVAANGAVAGFLVLYYVLLAQLDAGSGLLPVLWVGFAASLAGANADTWATELGVLNPGEPFLVSNGQRVPRGTSGAVSPTGILAALAGSGLVGAAAWLVSLAGWAPAGGPPLYVQFLVITLGGVIGSFVDSFLGATFQAVFFCENCQKETERSPLHTCGTTTIRKRGLRWLDNDWVNTACTLSAGLAGMFLAAMLG